MRLDAVEHLGPAGGLADILDDFAPRAQQQAMAAKVADALDERRVLICEAGTGTGKTLAYLVPALLSGQKVIVSTGTRSLQEQLSIVTCQWRSAPWASLPAPRC